MPTAARDHGLPVRLPVRRSRLGAGRRWPRATRGALRRSGRNRRREDRLWRRVVRLSAPGPTSIRAREPGSVTVLGMTDCVEPLPTTFRAAPPDWPIAGQFADAFGRRTSTPKGVTRRAARKDAKMTSCRCQRAAAGRAVPACAQSCYSSACAPPAGRHHLPVRRLLFSCRRKFSDEHHQRFPARQPRRQPVSARDTARCRQAADLCDHFAP